MTTPDAGADLSLELEYRGARVVTPRGQVFAAGSAVPVTYTLFDPAIDWTVKFWKFDAATESPDVALGVRRAALDAAGAHGSPGAPRLRERARVR